MLPRLHSKSVSWLVLASLGLMVITGGIMPSAVQAADGDTPPSTQSSGLVPCTDGPCTFKDFYVLIGNVVSFMIFSLAIPLATLTIFVSGIMYVWYADNPTQRKQATQYIRYALFGLVLALASYLIVSAILDFFLTVNPLDQAEITHNLTFNHWHV